MEDEWLVSISSKASSASSGKSEKIKQLNDRLLSESLSRQEAGDLYKKLQEEYDILLAKHAQAENTIDQLRIGARVNLFSDGPTPNQAVESKVIEFKLAPQPIFSKSDRAIVNGPNDVRLMKDSSAGNAVGNNDRVDGEDDRNLSKHSNEPENVKMNVALKLKDLQNDIGAFQSAIAEHELSYEQQRNLYNALKDKHDYLKSQIDKFNQEKSNREHGVDPIANDRLPAKFMDPNSLEGELYRLELRLGEVCDDIGEQLFSENQKAHGNNELEKALRNDFQRMRIGSKSSEKQTPNDRIEGRQNSFVSSRGHSRMSRSASILSEQSKDVNSFTEQEGSQSPQEKQPNYSEELAESGYYASESVTRESPRRGSASVPHRYLTRSHSPDVKHPGIPATKRHWSLSELNQPIESADELIVYSSESEFHEKYPDDPSRQDKRLIDWQDDRNSTRFSRDDSRIQRSTPPSRRSSTQSKRPNASPEQNQTGPAATSSPLDEHDNVSSHVAPSRKGNTSVKSSAGTSSVPGRSVSSKPASLNRTSPSWNARRDSHTEVRKPNARPSSRMSKSQTRTLPDTSSEASCENTRPDRVNSSVYSEQDKVPSLINQPKGNIYGLRQRPNTADSNVDSGFVGSEGTLRSQELHNGSKQRVLNSEKRDLIKPTQERYGGSEGEEMLEPSLQTKAPASNSRRESISNATDRKHPRNLRKSRLIRKDRKTAAEPEIWDNYSVADTGSSILPNQSRHLPIHSNHLSDDITSVDSRRIPLPQRRPYFPSAESSSTRLPRTQTESYRDNNDSKREQLKPRRDLHSKRSSFASVEPKLSVIYQEDDSYPTFPASRARKTHESFSSINDERDGEESTRSAPRSGRQKIPSVRSDNSSYERSKYSPEQRKESYFAEPLREELQLLRDQLARLSRTPAFTTPTRQQQSPANIRPIPVYSRNPIYDELKQKIQALSDQIDRNTQTDNDRNQIPESNYGSRESDELNRNFKDLKEKLDALAHDVRESNDIRPSFDNTPPLQQLSPTITPVCPICSGTGYHQHGDYVFPRDFMESGGPVTVIPSRESSVAAVNRTPNIASSTPYAKKNVTHLFDNTSTPIAYTTVPTSYRIISDVPVKEAKPVYPISNTIHHIHTFHDNHRSKLTSSSDYSSDEDDSRRRSRRQRQSRSRSRIINKTLDKTDDWRINDSLNEASRAASNMQRISKRMLHTLATDLINSGYSEL